jgi:tetraacyldisaccharide 4'-kinase
LVAGNQKLYLQILSFDVYSEKAVRKVKDIANTDKLLVAGIAKPQSFGYLQAANDVCMVFGSSSFQQKKI